MWWNTGLLGCLFWNDLMVEAYKWKHYIENNIDLSKRMLWSCKCSFSFKKIHENYQLRSCNSFPYVCLQRDNLKFISSPPLLRVIHFKSTFTTAVSDGNYQYNCMQNCFRLCPLISVGLYCKQSCTLLNLLSSVDLEGWNCASDSTVRLD